MKVLTFDIETTGDFSNGQFDISKQELTIACVHDSETGEYSSYLKEELPKLWPLFERADVIVGYNSDHFDIPILNRYYAGDLTKLKSVDLLKEIKNVLGRRLKLDNLAEATLGKKKSGSGLEAVRWFQDGEIDKVRQYCIDDVKITRALYDFAKEKGFLKYTDYDGPRDVKLDTSDWEKPSLAAGSMSMTLPF
jgi:DEAD/DEAH box helicase domain-containing protein